MIISQIDDPLDHDAQTLLSLLPEIKESNAYYYLQGALAAEGDDPILHGKRMHEDYLLSKRDNEAKPTLSPEEWYPLHVPDGELFCRFNIKGCLDRLFSAGKHIASVLEEHRLLSTRYQEYRKYDDYRMMTKPSITEPYPTYRFLLVANRLTALNAINEHLNGHSDAALQDLVNNYNDLLVQYQQYDELVGKMAIAQSLSEAIDIINTLARHANLTLPVLNEINAKNRDLEGAWAREFALSHATYLELDKRPDILGKSRMLPSWVVRALFKPNMTINGSYPVYQRIVDNSKLSHAEFAKIVSQHISPEVDPSWVRNYIGSNLLQLKTPDYNKQSARIYDLEAKIALYHQLSTINANEFDSINALDNPYYPEDEHVFSVDGKTICLTGPYTDERKMRCLQVGKKG